MTALKEKTDLNNSTGDFIKSLFKRLSGNRVNYDGAGSCIVNYVWINEEVFDSEEEDGDPQCGIPLNHVDYVIDNARRYPDAVFNIWLDRRYVENSPTEMILQSYLYLNDCPNIMIKDLNDIPDYANNKFYDPQSKTLVWQRVDTARLLVAEHMLTRHPEKIAVYADFDVQDVRIDCAEFEKAITKEGFVFGSTDPSGWCMENGYFAFHHRHIESGWLAELIGKAHNAVGKDCRNSVYNKYVSSIERYCLDRKLDTADYTIFVLERCGYKIPHNPEHDGISIQLG